MALSIKILLWYALFIRKRGKTLVLSNNAVPKWSEQATSCLRISDIVYSFSIASVLLTVYSIRAGCFTICLTQFPLYWRDKAENRKQDLCGGTAPLRST